MNFSIENKENLVIFSLNGRNLDSEISAKLKAELLIVCQPDIKGLIFDLTEIEYVDSSGLGALLLANRQLSDTNIPIILVGVQEMVKSMLSISQLTDLFIMLDSKNEAINYFSDKKEQ